MNPDMTHCDMQGNSLTGTILDLEGTGPWFQPSRVGFYEGLWIWDEDLFRGPLQRTSSEDYFWPSVTQRDRA